MNFYMEKNDIKEKLEKENNVTYVSTIEYCGKKYVKTIKSLKNGIEYLYYEIDNNKIIKVEDMELLSYFRKNYECKASNIIY